MCLFGYIHFPCYKDCRNKGSSSGLRFHLSSNCPNTTYAIHKVIGGIDDVQNYQCFLAAPFILEKQPWVLIFVDSMALAMRIALHLDSLLPPQFQEKGVVLHCYSVMSEQYLDRAHDAFTTPTDVCRIMVATSESAQSVVCLVLLLDKFFLSHFCRVSTLRM